VTTIEGLCYAVSAIAELLGIILVVREGQQAKRIYRGYLDRTQMPDNVVIAAFAARTPQSSYWRLEAAEKVFDYLMTSKARWGVAVTLLLAGVAFGTVGNFLGMGA
jgi:hypothetical protein